MEAQAEARGAGAQPAAGSKKGKAKAKGEQDLKPAEGGASNRRRLLYASWVDRHKRACGPDGMPEKQTDTSDVVQVLEHKLDAVTNDVLVLVKWDKDLRRANTWELEDAVHRHRADVLAGYWNAHPDGSREAAFKGTGHENEVFALWYPPLVRRNAGKWELAVEVEYRGYEGVSEVAADFLAKEIKHLMTEYWRQLGGKPKVT